MPLPSRLATLRTLLPWQKGLLLALFGALLLGGGHFALMAWLKSRPVCVLLLPPVLDPEAGMSPSQAQAVSNLAEDQLGYFAGATVFRVRTLPSPRDYRPEVEGLVLRIHPRRIGDGLQLDLELSRVSELRGGGGFHAIHGRARDPLKTFDWLCDKVKFASAHDGNGQLIPAVPGAFWNLVEARAHYLDRTFNERSEALLEEVRQKAPGCATPDVIEGVAMLYRAMEGVAPEQRTVRKAYQRFEAAMEKAPYHHRALFYLVYLKLESSEVRDAVGLSLAAHKALPECKDALLALGQAARYAGLLDLALSATEALDQRRLLMQPPMRTETAYLYAGDLDRYERSLWIEPNSADNAFVHFQMGYLALLRGHRDMALQHFKEAESDREWQGYRSLSRVFRLILEGNSAKAMQQLNQVEEEMTRTRFPDGETALLLADARALLGDLPGAMDLANRAFTLGFGCTAWYEKDPFLDPLRNTPRWRALLSHVKDRQALVERVYTQDRWGF